MAFTDEIIAELVREARYSRAEDAEHMARILRERRDKVGRHAFARVNPADRFRIVREGEGAEALEFDDLAVAGGLADRAATRYRYRLRGGAGGAGDAGDGRWRETAAPAVPLGPPPALEAGGGAAGAERRVMVELQSRRGRGGWSSATRVELLRGAATRIVGIAR